MGVRRPLVAGVALLVLSGAGFGVSQMFGRPMEEPIRTKSGVVVEWVGYVGEGYRSFNDLDKEASKSFRSQYVVFTFPYEPKTNSTEKYPTFFLSFDGEIVEPNWISGERGTPWSVGFERRLFPWNAKEIELGVASGFGEIVEERVNPTIDKVSPVKGGFDQAIFYEPHQLTRSEIEKVYSVFYADGDYLTGCGWVDRNGQRGHCFTGDLDKIEKLVVREREIEWFPIDWSHL